MGSVFLEVTHDPNANDPNQLLFCVQDTGIGISAENREVIFDSFSQADSTITRKFGGTGLGLAISRKLVEQMKGRIWLESQPGKGTRFYFTANLPLSDEDLSETTGSHISHTSAQLNTFSQIPPLNLLLAEDIKSNQDVIRLYLKDMPIQIEVAENGKIAVDRFRHQPLML